MFHQKCGKIQNTAHAVKAASATVSSGDHFTVDFFTNTDSNDPGNKQVLLHQTSDNSVKITVQVQIPTN